MKFFFKINNILGQLLLERLSNQFLLQRMAKIYDENSITGVWLGSKYPSGSTVILNLLHGNALETLLF